MELEEKPRRVKVIEETTKSSDTHKVNIALERYPNQRYKSNRDRRVRGKEVVEFVVESKPDKCKRPI